MLLNKGIKINKVISMVMVIAFFLSSCEESAPPQEVDPGVLEDIEAKLDEMDSKRALLVESIIRSSPTLAETSEIFAELGSDFNRDYLNDPNTERYVTLKDQGINLGVYLSDLAYISTYEQTQEVIFYMTSAQKMSEGIGVSDVFDESTRERMEMNINDRDSIISMISGMYWKTDGFLKELNRENISALIICGGWIEGMHIGGSMIRDGYDGDIIYDKILDQHKNLKKILSLLNTFEGDENIDLIELSLQEIEGNFSEIPAKSDGAFTAEQKESINLISQKITDLRNRITEV